MQRSDFQVDKRFANKFRARYGRHEFEVGIINDRPHLRPKSKKAGLGTLKGGQVRKKSLTPSGMSVSEVSKEVRKKVNFYKKPFERDSKDFRLFRREFMRFVGKQGGKRHKVISLLRAVVRNPILQGRYGRNATSTARAKGFNRFLIDTGQLYRAIEAKMRSKRV